jgi:hypothetical protein
MVIDDDATFLDRLIGEIRRRRPSGGRLDIMLDRIIAQLRRRSIECSDEGRPAFWRLVEVLAESLETGMSDAQLTRLMTAYLDEQPSIPDLRGRAKVEQSAAPIAGPPGPGWYQAPPGVCGHLVRLDKPCSKCQGRG